MSARLNGKIAIITGAASGIGAATARRFAEEGAAVCCADLNGPGAEAVARSIVSAGGTAHGQDLDVADETSWQDCIDCVLAEHGRLDILAHAAGISHASPIVDTTLADWRRVLAVNLDGAFLGVRAALRVMRTTGGSIVLVSSASGIRPPVGASAYGTSKAGLCAFSRAAAKECREQNIPVRINTVCPGGVKSPMWATMPFFQDLVRQTGSEDAAYAALAGEKPGARFAEPEEIAQAILYLASDEASYVTGHDLVIDQGYVL